jgi:RimJ/RimL family protein N-acetyltransferase
MQNEINTTRLRLHLLDLKDHDFIIALLNTAGWIQFIGQRNIRSKEDAVIYINKIMSNPNIFYWVVHTKEADRPVGLVSLIKRDYLDHTDIGFAFLPEYQGLGYAYEAANEVLQVATKLGYHPMLATTIPQNIQSIKLLNKLGLHFEKEISIENEVLHVYTNFIA